VTPKTPTSEISIDPADGYPADGWEAAGRKIAPMLGSYSAVVVTSSDNLSAAHVAIGIGLAEAEHRRVAIGDLIGEVEPIQSLVSTDDPHGISDSFAYGVSLNKVAQPIDTTGNLFIMPSGTGSVADPEIFRNSRWQRLANGFREVGALLIIVAPADASALQELIDQMDGVVLVGTSPLDFTPYLNVLARVPAPAELPGKRRKSGNNKALTSGPFAKSAKPADRIASAGAKKPLPIWAIAGLLLLLVALAGVGIYLKQESDVKRPPTRRRAAAPVAPAPPPANIEKPVQPAPETLAVAPPANPADSAISTGFAVELESFNDAGDATQALHRNKQYLRAGTISPVPVGAAREIYYKVISGAFPTHREAEVHLEVLRHDGVLVNVPGTVVRTPYALLIDSALANHTTDLVRKYAKLNQPVYVLSQKDGTLKLYAGAFERPEDSATLMTTLRAAQLNPTLVYRTGRSP